jgi:hypothetical protein
VKRDRGPDLPSERASFVPASETVIVNTSGGPVWANVIPLSLDEQRDIHHNRLRYAELQRLRLGLSNLYEQTVYRN